MTADVTGSGHPAPTSAVTTRERSTSEAPPPAAHPPARHLMPAAEIAERLGQHRPTDEQLAVIEAPLEPVLVVAGAGSGKTETMSARVVYLIANGLVAPDAVLGLTFTRKAAGELGERIRRRLRTLAARMSADGDSSWAALDARTPEASDAQLLASMQRPTVATYNSYAAGLVKEHGLRLGIEPGARLLGEASQWQLAQDIVERWTGDLGTDAALSTVVEAVRTMSGALSEHLVSTDEARARMTAIVDAMAATPDAKGKKGPYASTTKLMELMSHRVQLLDLVDEYRRRKRATDSLDFADQVALGAQLAEEHEEVRVAERARFRVVLLDEYQDTSYAQARMLGALFGDGHAVTAVGDPNQSIYGWRGASASGLSRFAEQFGDVGRVHHRALSTSWRNDQGILDVANTVAAPLRSPEQTRVPGAPAAAAGGRRPAGGTVSELHARPGAGAGHVSSAFTATEDEEATAVADFVSRWWRPRKSRDGATTAAVLCRSRKQFTAVEVALRSRGIPVEVVGLGGLLDAPEVVDVVALLQVVHDPSRGDSLMRLLTSPWMSLGAADLFAVADRVRELSRRHARAHGPDTSPETGPGEPGSAEDAVVVTEADIVDSHSIVDVLDDLPPTGWTSPGGRSLTEDGRARLVRLASLLSRLRASVYLSVPEIVVEAERTLGLDIEAGLLAGPHAARARANLDAFRDLALSFVDGADHPTLGAFLSWLDVATANERIDTAIAEPDPDAVQIVTIHAAKGLEWDVVAVPGLVDGGLPTTACAGPRGPSDSAWLTGLGTLPFPLRGDAPDLPVLAYDDAEDHKELDVRQQIFKQDAGEHQVTEERRLAYVAFTRARSRLLLTGSWFRGERSSATPPSLFLTELAEAGLVDPTAWTDMPEGANPALDRDVTATWPRTDDIPPALALAAQRVEAARDETAREAAGSDQAVRDQATRDRAARDRAGRDGAEPTAAAPAAPDLSHPRDDDTIPLTTLAELLLTERDARRQPVTDVEIPAHVSASAMVRLAAGRAEYALSLRRPVPSEPSVHARRGTTFHAWVEQFFSSPALVDLDDLDGADAVEPDADLDRLRETFLATEWAALDPIAIEVDIETPVGGVMTRSRIDAVFRDPLPDASPDHVVVVDWKTGREPTDPAATRAREVQLAVYRLAWSRWKDVPLEHVDAAFCYLGDGVTRRPATLLGPAELEELLRG